MLAKAIHCDLVETESTIGGGSLPGQTQGSIAIAFGDKCGPVELLARRLRTGAPGVFGRIDDGRLLLDLRTVLPEQDGMLFDAVAAAFSASGRQQG
jgi:L-seryl-tRNA(Ser) seleniumtransferase